MNPDIGRCSKFQRMLVEVYRVDGLNGMEWNRLTFVDGSFAHHLYQFPDFHLYSPIRI